MLKKTIIRPSTVKNTLLEPLKIESHNEEKITYQNEILQYYEKIKSADILKKKVNNQKISECSSSLLNQSKQTLNNNCTTLNSTNTETNNLKMSYSNCIKKNNSFKQYSQFHNSFSIGPSLKTRTFRSKRGIKNPKKNGFVTIKKNKKNRTEEIKFEKEDLLLAAYKNNPMPLLESVLKKTNPEKEIIKENAKNYFNKKNRMKHAFEQTQKNRTKRILKINNKSQDKKPILNKNGNYMEFIKNNNNNNQKETSSNKIIEQCIAINNHYYNPILQYLDDSDFVERNKFYRSKTENIDDIKNNSNSTVQKKEYKIDNNLWLNAPKTGENIFVFNKINSEEKEENTIAKNKKKNYVDASSDTSLDNIIPKNFQKNKIPNNKQYPMVNNTNINFELCYSKFKAYMPKLKLYKNSKYFNKTKIFNKNEDKKSNNSNIACKNDLKFYNFKEVVDLFGKKIELCKKPKILPYNTFRNRSFKFYSCSNNINIKLIRRQNYKSKTNIYRHPELPTKDSNMDCIEDIEASITQNFLNH